VSAAEVTGVHKGSTELSFIPRGVKGGDFAFDIGTAGSTPLVLQTVIPALLFAERKSTVTLTGGTHVPFSPSFHYLAEVFAPTLKTLGVEVRLAIDSYGFYPRGGGRVRAEIVPTKGLKPLRVAERGRVINVRGYSAVGNLPLSIAERQRDAALERIHGRLLHFKEGIGIELLQAPTPGQGTFLFLRAEAEHSVAGFTALGERGKRAEAVGSEAAAEFLNYYATDAALDPHLADQIVLYLSLCEGESVFSTASITPHLLTNLWVLGLFRKFRHDIDGEPGNSGKIRMNFHS
ncbi:MAG: RNA 3'-terminal phosphate, partial [Geobacteraceae bacterium]